MGGKARKLGGGWGGAWEKKTQGESLKERKVERDPEQKNKDIEQANFVPN